MSLINHIQVQTPSSCCGCSACKQRCPKQCISMQRDSEGFLYPNVSEQECIDCGLCLKVCPNLNRFDETEPFKVLAAQSKSDALLKVSSSGGMFTEIATKVIEADGVVFGARFDADWQVVMDYIETIEGLSVFRGSKYVQCKPRNSYKDAEHFLKEGRYVLYTGSSCQIAGLKRFLRKEYDNLLCMDYLCHGAPSPRVWEKYLKEVANTADKAVGGKSTVSLSLNTMLTIEDVKFRDKSNGWKKFRFVLHLAEASADGKESSVLSSVFAENIYMKGFLSDMTLRPSCYQCFARNGHSGADITIGDHWAITDICPEFDAEEKGTSLVLVNTEKGELMMKSLDVRTIETDYEKSKQWNGAFYPTTEEHLHRKRFFRKLQYRDDVSRLIEEELGITIWDKIMKRVNKIVRK